LTSLVSERVEGHFQKKALSFDALYDEDAWLSHRFRPGLVRRRELAVATVMAYANPSVLDIGCGSGRVGEDVLEAGAAKYVGFDLAEQMLDLARTRLARFGDRVTLVRGDFITAPPAGSFDVVLGLGLFDYVANPGAFTQQIGNLCAGSAVASFPKWHWLKGPIRKLRYEVVNDCPIFDYSEAQIRRLFAESGFSRIDVLAPGKTGYLVRADR
jgi:SAM-dependent methyltransferase